ncbi:Spondin_N [Photobacterium aquimaris]|uniref:Spondin_N n=2 Tax=Photobacterium aquimaris TaxID=512643 RepID=A0A1Y6KX78_9GAMM|nr:Spondin_N [Photobacterium aquimaris]
MVTKMKQYLFSFFVGILFLIGGCGSDSDDFNRQSETATYELTFTSNWSNTNFPTNYPNNRHFSGLIGLTHNSNVNLFKVGELASAGVVTVAETGSKDDIKPEINSVINTGKGHTTIDGDGLSVANLDAGENSVTVTFTVTQDFPLISLVTMLAPSPDWFAGIDSLSLKDGDNWLTTLSKDVKTYDAGSDDGTTFTANNAPLTPHVNISLLTSERTDTDFENGLHYSNGLPIGTIAIKRIE